MAGQSFSPSLGARTLQRKEIELSLPTYRKLLDQISTIRESAAAYQREKTENEDSQNAFLRPQAINNLSILGPRGSGKSSILKTLYHDLEAEKGKNILLPPIVPENLESHMTLMSSLLGLLNDQVKKLLEKHQPRHPICPPERDPLEEEHRQLVECYVHLQKPYQDISIQKYTTESDYVRTMSNVFGANDQFFCKLWNFIDHLLGRYEEDTLLFVFIDDIDLSTYRCSDVVRTLLGYISHPRVVTVLAGDIEVFGEALTLDFLRQEELLGKEGITQSYTVSKLSSESGKDLLSRKKELAYEYLKKVMPPMNRHSISIWTLSNRGKFSPVGLYDSTNEDISLQAVLGKLSQRHAPLNGYFSSPGGQESTPDDQVLYHLFDSTARGLINCYIPIEQLATQWDPEKKPFENIKFTLETVIFSNSKLNALRDLIFSRFLQLGSGYSSTYIFFQNFNDWTDKELPYLADYGSTKTAKEKQAQEAVVKKAQEAAVSLERETQVFQIFVYLDWAARLLDKTAELDSGEYETAKKRALFLLCANGAISEKTDELPAAGRVRLYQLGITNFNIRTYSDCAAAIALRCFFGLPFPLAVRYFRSFNVSQMLETLSNPVDRKYPAAALDKLQRAVDFIDVLNRFYGDHPSAASTCLAEQPEMLEFIESQLKSTQNAMLVSVICNAYFKNADNDSGNGTLPPLYGQYCKNGITFINRHAQENEIGDVSFHHYPYSLMKASKREQLNSRDLNSYFRTPRTPPYSEYRFIAIRNSFTKIKTISSIEHDNQITVAESHCAYDWNNLFEENRDSSGATPIYNFYSEWFWARIADDNHHLKFLKDTYKDPAAQANTLCGDSQKPETVHDMEQRLKVLFAIDSSGLWDLGAHNAEDESPIQQIKAYILKQLRSSEDSLVGAWNLPPETIISGSGEVETPCWSMVATNGASAAFDRLKNAYTGSSRTLAKRCIHLLGPLFEGKGARPHDSG